MLKNIQNKQITMDHHQSYEDTLRLDQKGSGVLSKLRKELTISTTPCKGFQLFVARKVITPVCK